MPDSASALAAWETFYVIVGSAGGALVGLQFVVMTLIADRGRGTSEITLDAFGTPTVVHLSGAFVLSAIMSVPWPSSASLSMAIATSGLAGLAYCAIVVRRARRQTEYKPVWEDWLWYIALPLLCYTALTVAGLLLGTSPQPALFVVGAVTLGLLLIGIHNAWDTVTHIVITSAASHSDDAPTKVDRTRKRHQRK